jgi:hypothetical protein
MSDIPTAEEMEVAKKMHDSVLSPKHYTQGDIECIDAMESCLGPRKFEGFLHGQIFKYQWRYEDKGGVEDLRKMSFYKDKLIRHLINLKEPK